MQSNLLVSIRRHHEKSVRCHFFHAILRLLINHVEKWAVLRCKKGRFAIRQRDNYKFRCHIIVDAVAAVPRPCRIQNLERVRIIIVSMNATFCIECLNNIWWIVAWRLRLFFHALRFFRNWNRTHFLRRALTKFTWRDCHRFLERCYWKFRWQFEKISRYRLHWTFKTIDWISNENWLCEFSTIFYHIYTVSD